MKTSLWKTHRICIFREGIVHDFGQKIWNFVNISFYCKWHREKVFSDVLVKKQAF